MSLANLRQMESLTQEVDKKMKHCGLADSSDEGQSTSAVDSFSSNDERSKDAKARGKQRKKLKSGKMAKITTGIVNPQIWPHSELSLTHVSKEVSYDDLTIEEFTAGYCPILKNSRISNEEKAARISHLYDLKYLAMHYEWAAVRRFHTAVLIEIERDQIHCGDYFNHLERLSFHDQAKKNVQSKLPKVQSNPVLFYRDCQRGKCHSDKDHYGSVRGTKRWLQHICTKCWISSRTVEWHPEFASSCPFGESAQESNTASLSSPH